MNEGSGRGLCKRIFAVVKAANILDISFAEAFEKQPIQLLQLLSLKAQDSFDEARVLVQSHPMPATSLAKILAESFLKVLFIFLSWWNLCFRESLVTIEYLYLVFYFLNSLFAWF